MKDEVTNKRVNVADCKPHPRNYNTHDDAQVEDLRESLRQFGQVRSIVVQATKKVSEYLIVAGHGVTEAARLEGVKTLKADVIPAAWRPARVLAYLAADNELARRGNPDEAQLAAIVAEVQKKEGDVLARLAAGEQKALDNLLRLANAENGMADAEPQIDRAEELLAKWGVEIGQLWRVGEHRLICGNCLDAEIVQRLLHDEQPAIIIADPPYGVNIVAANGYVGSGEAYNIPFGGVKRKGYVGGENQIKARTGHYPIESWKGNKRLGSAYAAKPFGSQKNRVRGSDRAAHVVDVGKYIPVDGDETTETAIKASSFYLQQFPESTQVWWGANYYADSLKPSMCWLVWDKETTGNFADCELAWVNIERAAKLFRHRWNGMLRDSERERRWHPTQKPAALAAWILNEFSVENDIVIDPFAGAGWSMLGAENARRKARVIEKIPEYCAVILERMAMAFPGIEIERLE